MKARGSLRRMLLMTGGALAMTLGPFAPGAATAQEGAIRACSRRGAGFFARDAAGQASGLFGEGNAEFLTSEIANSAPRP